MARDHLELSVDGSVRPTSRDVSFPVGRNPAKATKHLNSLTAIRVLARSKNSRPVGFLL